MMINVHDIMDTLLRRYERRYLHSFVRTKVRRYEGTKVIFINTFGIRYVPSNEGNKEAYYHSLAY